MAQFTIEGTYLSSERNSGTFDPEDRPGTSIQYDYTVLKVLTGDSVTDVRLPKGVHVHDFQKGDEVRLVCDVFGRPKIVATLASLGLASDGDGLRAV